MVDWNKLSGREVVEKTIKALKANGIEVFFVDNGADAKKKVFELIPKGAEVMNMTSVTLDTLGITEEIMESGDYDAVKKKFSTMNSKTQGREMRKMGAGPDFAVGSAHALTKDGHIMIASNTGSQLPAYAYGAGKVIFVIGGQKIVEDTVMGMRRVYEHSLPLESERAKKAYGASGSAVNKLLILNNELQKDRIVVIIVNEVLGF